MRRLLLVATVGLAVACGGQSQPTAVPLTALEQRLAQGVASRPATPPPSPTIDPGTPEPTWTPPPFGRRTTPSPIAPLAGRPAEVLRIESERAVAVRIDGREETVAFVGVRSLAATQLGHPVECFGVDAVEMLRQAMPIGSPIEVEEDAAVASHDNAGRRRLYVWLPDGRLANSELLREGFGQLAPSDSRARHYQTFRSVESEAARQGLGIWSNLSCHGNSGRSG